MLKSLIKANISYSRGFIIKSNACHEKRYLSIYFFNQEYLNRKENKIQDNIFAKGIPI